MALLFSIGCFSGLEASVLILFLFLFFVMLRLSIRSSFFYKNTFWNISFSASCIFIVAMFFATLRWSFLVKESLLLLGTAMKLV